MNDQQPRDAFTVNEWCDRRRIKRSTYYKLQKLGKGPRLHHANTKPLISAEADAEWLAEREAEAASDNGGA